MPGSPLNAQTRSVKLVVRPAGRSARRMGRRQSSGKPETMTDPQRTDFSVVLPAHNEAENIVPMITALKTIVAPLGTAEIIIVDDGSTDRTLAAIRAAAATDPMVRYIAFTRN